MRAERLHSFLRALREDFDRTKLPEQMTELAAAYEQLATSPSEPSYQQRVSTARTQLEIALNEPMNVDERAWRDAARELGISDLLGTELRDRLQEIFVREEMTPSAIAPEVQPIANRIAELNDVINSVLAGLEALNVGQEDLPPGAWEIEIVVPRDWVDSELDRLGEEFEQLDRILKPFVELEGGSRPPIKVASISSSGFTVFVMAAGPMALSFAKGVNMIADAYLKYQQARVAKATLRDLEMSDDELQVITDKVDEFMSARTREIAEEVVAEFGASLDAGRRNEIEIEMTKSLDRLGPRLERGFHVDVHVGLVAPPDDTDPDDAEAQEIAAQNQENLESISETRRALRKLELSGEPILSLPPPLDDDGEAEDD